MKTLTVRLEDELMNKIEELSALKDKSKSDFVREALIQQVDNVQVEQRNIPQEVKNKTEFLLQILSCGKFNEFNEMNFKLITGEVEKLWHMVRQ